MQEGFSACGFARAEKLSKERETELREWLARGEHGDMEYLARNVEKKVNPCMLVEGAKTIVSAAINYCPNEAIQREKEAQPLCLAKYAYGTDYHEIVKQKLRNVLKKIGLEEGIAARVFVDTAPIDEKYWAEQAGLGWRGKNSQLIIPKMGSYFFLGEIVLTQEVDKYDEKAKNRCGKCNACIEACPTKALHGNGTLDARKCLSYLTIEYRGDLPNDAKKKMSPCFYGCDRCADACPWNKRFARITSVETFRAREQILAMSTHDWEHLSVEKYRELFRNSAVKRAKYEGLMRNIRAVLEENSE